MDWININKELPENQKLVQIAYVNKVGSTRKNRFKCNKNINNFKLITDHPTIKRIKKEIKEAGKSCPENWK